MTRSDYINHLLNIGAKRISSTPLYDIYMIINVTIEVYSTRAVCNEKEVWTSDKN